MLDMMVVMVVIRGTSDAVVVDSIAGLPNAVQLIESVCFVALVWFAVRVQEVVRRRCRWYDRGSAEREEAASVRSRFERRGCV